MAVPPRPAATIVLLRDGASGLEVLLVQRSRSVGFFPRAWVFPGGVVEDEDRDRGFVGTMPKLPKDRIAFVAAAVREAFEEIGLALVADEEPIDLGALDLWAWWITPDNEIRRFDTLFFVASANGMGLPTTDGVEIVKAVWFRPSEVVGRWSGPDQVLAPPTYRTVDELCAFDSVDDVRKAARARPHQAIQPLLQRSDDGRVEVRIVEQKVRLAYLDGRWSTAVL